MKQQPRLLKRGPRFLSERFAEDEDKETILRDVAEILEQMEHAEVRRLITEDKVRPDGRRG
ncbi:MAG: hypothetical protein ACLS3V_04495 [Streptococcus sp.]